MQSPLCGVEGSLPKPCGKAGGGSLGKGGTECCGGRMKKEAGGPEGDFRRRDLSKKDCFLVTRFTRKTLCLQHERSRASENSPGGREA